MNPYTINPISASRRFLENPSPNPDDKDNNPLKDQPKNQAQKKSPSDLSPEEFIREVSWSETDVIQSYLPFASNIDPLARNKSLWIYHEMEQDEQVKAAIDLRCQARLSTSWDIKPGLPGNELSEEMAKFIKTNFKGMSGTFENNLEQIYSAIAYGFSVTEKVYKYIDQGKFKGKIGLKALKTREPYRYDFKIDSHGNLLGLVYLGPIGKDDSENGPPFGINSPSFFPTNQILQQQILGTNGKGRMGTIENPFPPEKFVIYSYNTRFGNWYGRSDLLPAFKWWLMKRHGTKFWAIWLERYASPFLYAQYKRDAGLKKQALEAVDDFIRNLSARQGIRLSDAWTLTPIQFSGSSNDVYEKSIESYNRFIARAIMMPTLLGFTSEQAAGSYARSKTHYDAFVWILEKLGRDTSEDIVGEQIIKPLIKVNYGDVDDELIPKFSFLSIEEDSIDVRSQIITRLGQFGFVDVNENWVREFLTLPPKDPDLQLLPGNPNLNLNHPVNNPDAQSDSANDGKQKNNVGNNKKEEKDSKKESSEKEVIVYKDPFGRSLTDFEEKVQIKKFTKNMESVESGLQKDASIVLEDMKDDLISQVIRKKVISDGDASLLKKIALNPKPLKEVFEKWITKVWLDSSLGVLEELKRSGLEITIIRKFSLFAELDDETAPWENWQPLPPEKAIDFFRRKTNASIINKDGKRLLIDLAGNVDLDFVRQKAFTIAGIIRDDILNDAKQIILNGLKRGDETSAVIDLKNMFNRYLDQGIAVDDEILTPSRLLTIVRTNTTEAINMGRKAMMEDPDIVGFVQFFQYSAILDSRTTDYCRCMDSKRFRIEQLADIHPPAHYNCRSFTVPISETEVERLKESGKGVELSEPCPDRMAGFMDVKREPVQVNPVPPRDDINPSQRIPTVIPKKEPERIPDGNPAKREDDLTEKLKNDLLQIITRCPYQTCLSDDIQFVSRRMNIGEFLCNSCGLPFRISSMGDIYLYDAGLEEWKRTSMGGFPKIFKTGKS